MRVIPPNGVPQNGAAGNPKNGFPTASGKPKNPDIKPGAENDDLDLALEDLKAIEEIEEQLEADFDELIKARAEADELRERFLRLQAEWDNFRKRTSSERAAERKRAAAHLVESLLPVIDDIERAIEHSDSAGEAPLREGILAVYAKLIGVLEKEGVVLIDPLGEPFDANLHSAIGVAADDTVDEETVVQVYQKGYEMGGRLLRPAMVIVSTR